MTAVYKQDTAMCMCLSGITVRQRCIGSCNDSFENQHYTVIKHALKHVEPYSSFLQLTCLPQFIAQRSACWCYQAYHVHNHMLCQHDSMTVNGYGKACTFPSRRHTGSVKRFLLEESLKHHCGDLLAPLPADALHNLFKAHSACKLSCTVSHIQTVQNASQGQLSFGTAKPSAICCCAVQYTRHPLCICLLAADEISKDQNPNVWLSVCLCAFVSEYSCVSSC